MSDSEALTQNKVRGVFCRNGAPTRVWRNLVGKFWRLGPKARCSVCETSHVNGSSILDSHMVACGLGVGSADLVGLQQILITPEHLGLTLGVFFGAEIKTAKGRASEEQEAWIKTINQFGGAARIFRSDAEAEAYLKELHSWRPTR